MPHEVHASIQVMLPDDPKGMAETLSDVAAAWANLLAAIPQLCTPTFSVNETRTKAAGVKRTRKPGKPAAFLTEPPAPELAA
jgi:hypothetical protein